MKKYLVKPGEKIKLADRATKDTGEFSKSKQDLREQLTSINSKLEELQEKLYAEHKHKVLVIIQAMDTGGKDGVIRHVFEGVNPQGVNVASFKVPTSVELDHDYLWRAHAQVPGKGEITIFNRSYYEDVLVVRVHELVPKTAWQRRYAHINDFERMLVEEGTTILKFFLHISAKEQKQRLLQRLEDPEKRWKFNPADLEERKLWKQYMQAYQDVLSQTSTKVAPWYIVPADNKPYRNLVVGSILVEALENLKPKYPRADFDVDVMLAELEKS
jgi:PPK2 family polyphosphate:nucleotide phosphotransferase